MGASRKRYGKSISTLISNKRLKRDCQRAAFPVPIAEVVTVVLFEFSVMRCQPLRRALGEWSVD